MPNPQVIAQRVRMAFNIANWLPSSVTDLIAGQSPQFASGAALQLEMMFSYGTLADSPSTVLDLSPYASIIVALQSSATPHEGTTYWSQSVANAAFSNSVTAALWNGLQPNTIAQATAQIPSSVWTTLSYTPGQSYWMVIYGVTWPQILALVAIASGGTGYTVGDTLTIAGGTLQTGAAAAVVKVTSISGGGGTGPITGLQILSFGGWSVNPSSPNGPTGGTGNSASLTLTFTTIAQDVPLTSFPLTVQDTGMPVGNVLSAPSLIGVQSFLCSDGLYRKFAIQQDPGGNWVPVVVNQTGTSSP